MLLDPGVRSGKWGSCVVFVVVVVGGGGVVVVVVVVVVVIVAVRCNLMLIVL